MNACVGRRLVGQFNDELTLPYAFLLPDMSRQQTAAWPEEHLTSLVFVCCIFTQGKSLCQNLPQTSFLNMYSCVG